jgi:hypothetical protein
LHELAQSCLSNDVLEPVIPVRENVDRHALANSPQCFYRVFECDPVAGEALDQDRIECSHELKNAEGRTQCAIIGVIELGFDRDGPELTALDLDGEIDKLVSTRNVAQLQIESDFGRRIAEDNLAGQIEMQPPLGMSVSDR